MESGRTDVTKKTSSWNTLMNSVYTWATTPVPPQTDMLPAPKRHYRRVTKYENNVAASIALPERPKLRQPACKVTSETSVSSITRDTLTSLHNVFTFFTVPAKTEQKAEKINIVVPPRKPKKNDIDVQMIKLVAELKKLDEEKDHAAIEKNYLAQLNLVEYEIMEHAQRRVDLYFYLLVAVYKQGALIEKKSTLIQHGKGSHERGTAACHSSLFPGVKLKFPDNTTNKLWSLIAEMPSIRDTHFEDSSNMTTELPVMVNDFDTYLELATPGRQSAPSKYVKKCLEILNQASRGEITPIEGMNRFLKNIKIFFIEFEQKHLNEATFKYPAAMRRIWELQQTGMLRAQSDESDTFDYDYLCSLLRIAPAKAAKLIHDPTELLNCCLNLQKEIFANQSKDKHSKSSGTKPKPLKMG